MNNKENQKVIETVSHEERVIYDQWKELHDLCVNPGTLSEIQTIIVPTGGWLERADLGLSLFNVLSHTGHEPQMVITGENGSQVRRAKGDTLGKASDIARAIKWFGGLTSEEKERIVIDNEATNTRKQAINVYQLIKEEKIKSPLIAAVSEWHLPRWYMTMVKEILNNEGENLQTKLFAISTMGRLKDATKDDLTQDRFHRIIGEIQRIEKYREQGDVATREELERYLTWLNKSSS